MRQSLNSANESGGIIVRASCAVQGRPVKWYLGSVWYSLSRASAVSMQLRANLDMLQWCSLLGVSRVVARLSGLMSCPGQLSHSAAALPTHDKPTQATLLLARYIWHKDSCCCCCSEAPSGNKFVVI